MKSYLTDDFLEHFAHLPENVKRLARKNYRLWKQDHTHPGLHFKPIRRGEGIYSVRIGRDWRALGLREADTIYWFWIGSHADYDNLLAQR